MTIRAAVLYVIDDLGFKTLKEHCAPALNDLSTRGAFFPRCWATPLCRPSRAALLTGRYGARTGHLHNQQITQAKLALSPQWPAIPELLQIGSAPFAAVTGKWQHFENPDALGFDDWLIWRHLGPDGNDPPVLASYTGPREPAEGPVPGRPPRYCHPYLEDASARIVETTNTDFGPLLCQDWLLDLMTDEIHGTTSPLPFFALYSDLLMHQEWNHDLRKVTYPYDLDASLAAHLTLSYLTRFLDQLATRGLHSSVLVLVTSDNGTSGGSKGSTSKQSGQRVPCFAFGPGIAPGIRHQLVDAVDFCPTILQALDSPLSPHFGDGHPIPIFDPHAPSRSWIMSSFAPSPDTPAGPLGLGPAIRSAKGYMIDHEGNAWAIRRPNDPMEEYFFGEDPLHREVGKLDTIRDYWSWGA